MAGRRYGEGWSPISDYRGYALLSDAQALRDELDPEIFNTIVYGTGPYRYPQSNAEADELLDLLRQMREAKRARERAGTTE
jgi:hypothetical protein